MTDFWAVEDGALVKCVLYSAITAAGYHLFICESSELLEMMDSFIPLNNGFIYISKGLKVGRDEGSMLFNVSE